MPDYKFKVGDKVQVPGDMHGAQLEWLGAKGKVTALRGSESGGRQVLGQAPRHEPWVPLYEVLFEGRKSGELVPETMLRKLS